MTYIPWIVIAAVVVVIGLGTWISGSGNPDYKLTFGPEKPWRSS